MPEWNTDAELFELVKTELHTPAIGNILDRRGHFLRFLASEIRPIEPHMKLAGWALPVLQGAVAGNRQPPFGRMTKALDALLPGEV